MPSDTFRIQGLNSDNRCLRINTTAHVSQLKIWKGFVDDESDDEYASDESSVDGDVVPPEREIPVDNCERQPAENTDVGTSNDNDVTENSRKRTRRLPKKFQDFVM